MPWMLLIAVLVIGIASSTAEGRRDARQKFARYNRPLMIAMMLTIAIILIPELLKPG